MIDGRTRTCGLIGNPVEHTLSPAIHNFLAERMDQNLVYLPFPVKEGSLETAVCGAAALDMLGLNVTVPYKQEVIPFLAAVDELAARIGAVNTLVREGNGFKGYNTDMPGLRRAMESDGVCLEGERTVILGAGGVARAVAMMLAGSGVREILILNRTLGRAQDIVREVNGYAGTEIARAMSLGDYQGLAEEKELLVIQATKVGMYPLTEEAALSDEGFYRRVKVGYDLIYNPMETKFMKLVGQAGGKAYNGFKMLLYQGIIAFELWTGVKVSEELAKETYEHVLREWNGWQ